MLLGHSQGSALGSLLVYANKMPLQVKCGMAVSFSLLMIHTSLIHSGETPGIVT